VTLEIRFIRVIGIIRAIKVICTSFLIWVLHLPLVSSLFTDTVYIHIGLLGLSGLSGSSQVELYMKHIS